MEALHNGFKRVLRLAPSDGPRLCFRGPSTQAPGWTGSLGNVDRERRWLLPDRVAPDDP